MTADDRRFAIANTVSPEAREKMLQAWQLFQQLPGDDSAFPTTPEEWAKQRASRNAMAEFFQKPYLDALSPETVEMNLAGVPAISVRVDTPNPLPGVIVYLHGGAFTHYSARSSLKAAVMMAKASGREVISIDYPLAPEANFMEVTAATLRAVVRIAENTPPDQIAIFGTSAGGSIAAATALRMRDEEHSMPGALVLHSPGTDCNWTGDSFLTMGDRDPAMDEDDIGRRVQSYAAPEHYDHPYASPVLGDYAKGFPPTLIQTGTREFLLSDSVRLYRAIRDAGNEAVIDLYEGMPHVFATMFDGIPESDTAFEVARTFLDRTLARSRT